MTPSESQLTSEQRLKQTEILLATAAKMINELTYKQDRNSEAIDRLTQKQDRNSEIIAETSKLTKDNAEGIQNLRVTLAKTIDLFTDSMKVIRKMQAEVKQMQSEVRGIQIENQRMLRHLFGEDER